MSINISSSSALNTTEKINEVIRATIRKDKVAKRRMAQEERRKVYRKKMAENEEKRAEREKRERDSFTRMRK